jgi:hypothetical protein
VSLKTPRFKSSASLSVVTRCDQRLGAAFRVFRAVFRAAFRAVLRVAMLCEAADFRCPVMPTPICFGQRG